MGFVKKQASDLNDTRKSIYKEVERGVKNPDVWKAAALVAAPWALPALGSMAAAGVQGVAGLFTGAGAAGAGGAAGGGGFMSTLMGGASKAFGAAKAFGAGLLPGGETGMSAGDPTGDGFFSGIMSGAKNIVGGMSDEIKNKIKDPEYMKGLLMRAGSHLAGSKLAGDGLSDEERKLMEAMARDLDNLRSQDAKLFDQKMNVAAQVIREGRNVDPERVGLKAQRDVQIAGGVQSREADREAKMREGGRGLSAADRRRAGLEVTREAQSAYLEGLGTGQDRRTKTIAAGASMLPNAAPTGALNAGLDLAGRMDIQEDRRRTAAADTGKFIQDTFGHDKAKSTGGLDLKDAIKDGVKEVVSKPLKKDENAAQ